MYARINLLHFKPGTLDKGHERARVASAAYKALKGFKSMVFIGDDEANEFGSFSLWETKEDAEAASEGLRPRMMEEVGDLFTAPPTTRVFEVHEVEA